MVEWGYRYRCNTRIIIINTRFIPNIIIDGTYRTGKRTCNVFRDARLGEILFALLNIYL